MFADAEGHSLSILGYQFTLLQTSNSLLQLLQSHTTHTKQIFQHSIILLLLLHNERILGIGEYDKILTIQGKLCGYAE